MASRKFEIVFSPAVQKVYDPIKDKKLLRGINRTLDEIAENPYQFPKLSGPLEGFRKVKTFSYRIVYRILETKVRVFIFAIGPRQTFINNLPFCHHR